MDEACQNVLAKAGGTSQLQPEQKEEVRNVLIQGLTKSYEISNDSVAQEVDKFLENGRATSSNLSRLERRVQKKAAQSSGPAATATSDAFTRNCSDAASQFSVGSVKSARIKAQYGTPRLPKVPEEAATPRSALSMTGRSLVGNTNNTKGKDWSNIAKYAHQLDEQDKKRQKAGITALRQRMRAELDKQVAEQKERNNQVKEEEKKWFESQCEEWSQWRDMEEMKKEQDKAKAASMKASREEQVCHLRKLRAEEAKKKKDEDLELVEKVAVEVEKDKKQAEEQKQTKKQAMFKLLKESGEETRSKNEQRRKQVQEEIESMKEYNKMLDAQDAAKKKEVEVRRVKQVQLAEKMKVIVAQQNASKGDLDQQIATMQKEEADGRAIAALQFKEDRLKEMRMQNQAFLFQQMAEKEERKKEEKELKMLQAEILQEETKSFLDIEKQRSRDRRNKNVAHRLDLESQIAIVKEKPSRDAMSHAEYMMNQQILDLADDLHAKSTQQ